MIRSRFFDPWYQTGYDTPPELVNEYMEARIKFDIFVRQWFGMWYHSAISLMLVEITVRNNQQLKAQIMLYIINAIFNAILFGIYFDLLEVLRKKQHNHQADIDNSNTAMQNLHLPEGIQQ